MPLKLKLSGQLFRCGRCRKPYSNPFGHVCVSNRRTGRRRVKPRTRISLVVCGTCGKEYSIALGHVCVVKSDLRKRKASAKRRAAAEARREKAAAARAREDEARRRRRAAERPAGHGQRNAHDWRTCRDRDCERPLCEAYRAGIADGGERAGQ